MSESCEKSVCAGTRRPVPGSTASVASSRSRINVVLWSMIVTRERQMTANEDDRDIGVQYSCTAAIDQFPVLEL